MSFTPSPEHSERVLDWYVSGYGTTLDLYAHNYSQLFCPAKVIFAGVDVLLLVRILLLHTFARVVVTQKCQAARDVRASKASLIDVFECMENFFHRLEVYTKVEPTIEMMELIMRIMVEVLTILAIATKEINQSRTSEIPIYGYIAVD
jgi:hypothetical protein